jgi:hypothetical protein
VIILGISSVFALIRTFLFQLVGMQLVVRLRKYTFEAILRQDISFFDVTRTGELTNRYPLEGRRKEGGRRMKEEGGRRKEEGRRKEGGRREEGGPQKTGIGDEGDVKRREEGEI